MGRSPIIIIIGLRPKRKSDGKVLHPEGERISYILGKFGLEVTNTGIVVDKGDEEAPTAEVAAEAE